MLRNSLILAASLCIGLLIFAWAENVLAPSFQACISDEISQQRAKGAEDKGFSVAAFASRQSICTLRLVDKHNGFFAAIAAIIVAAFTGTLWLATTRQAALTKEALIADKRAFVFVTAVNQKYEAVLDSNGNVVSYNWRFRPVWRNSGDSPVRHLRIHANCELRNTVLPDNFNFAYPTNNVGSGLLGPRFENEGSLAPMPPVSPITPQDIADVQNSRKYLYVMGWAKYRDIFPGTPEHITRFCWQFFPEGDPHAFIPNDAVHFLRFTSAHHPQGNCADDECDC